jgi:hypothetical protein
MVVYTHFASFIRLAEFIGSWNSISRPSSNTIDRIIDKVWSPDSLFFCLWWVRYWEWRNLCLNYSPLAPRRKITGHQSCKWQIIQGSNAPQSIFCVYEHMRIPAYVSIMSFLPFNIRRCFSNLKSPMCKWISDAASKPNSFSRGGVMCCANSLVITIQPQQLIFLWRNPQSVLVQIYSIRLYLILLNQSKTISSLQRCNQIPLWPELPSQ